jgi:AraC-like DNA-binding protein
MLLQSSPGLLSTCPWISPFRSDDLDEVRQFFGSYSGSKARVAHGRQPMGCVSYAVEGRRTALGATGSAVAQTARWVVHGPVFQLAMPPGSVYRTGRQVSPPSTPSDVVLVPPSWEWARTSPPGSVLALHVEPGALQDELQALRPSGGGALPRSLVTRPVEPARRARLIAAAAAVALATRPGADPQQLALAEARLLAEASQLVPDGPASQPPADVSEQRVRNLEGWIEANLAEPITLGTLCRVAGVGARCLQRAFEQRRGVSPMRFVAERRLAATHRALVRAGPGASVTGIALANGFDHVGRFAKLYREVIGELPSRTLARPRRA